MKKYGFGFAIVLLASAQNINAGGYDSSGYAHNYTRMRAAEKSNMAFLESQCRKRHSPLHFRKNIPEAFGFVNKDLTGVRRQKLIPLGSYVTTTSVEGHARRFTYLDLESGFPKIITKTIWVHDRWKHENVIEMKWLDGANGALGSYVTDLRPVSNSFRVHPVGYVKGNNLCAQISGLALALRLGGPTLPIPERYIAREQRPSIKIEITR